MNHNNKLVTGWFKHIPEYIPPNKTGDDFLDKLLELVAYREYQAEWQPELKIQERLRIMISEIKAFKGIDDF